MSADAKVWLDDAGYWRAVHDGTCTDEHTGTAYDLAWLLREVERCMQHENMRWEVRVYPDGKFGLSGWTW